MPYANMPGTVEFTEFAVNFAANVKQLLKERAMTEGQIPINAGDLPIDTVTLEESNVYTGYLRRASVSPKPDRNGNVFCALQLEVAQGDFEGVTVQMNYLPLPQALSSDMTKAQKIKAQNLSAPFGRFCRAFKIHGMIPPVSLTDPRSVGIFQEWITQFYDSIGKFTVRNQEFPEGSGRMRSGVSDFVF